ncbi:hypothetical protein HQN89_15430 [Paenibacillus frigoriresistens]|nr:hypothetical protein [Paenibacillus frigoriresistens]
MAKADHSTISKKAKDVPFEVFKQLLSLMIQKCNRPTRRRLRIPKELLVVDSTKITVGIGRLPWAPLKGEKAGIRLHVSLIADAGKLHKVTETTGYRPDISSCKDVLDDRFILVAEARQSMYAQRMSFQDFRKVAEPYSRESGGTLAELNTDQAAITTWKKARRANGFIVRLQEIAGCVQSPNLFIPGKRIAAAWLTDLLENESSELPIESDGSIRIPIQPWGLSTVRIEMV